MKTDHEQLIEIEPIMRRLGWWPDEISRDTAWGFGQPSPLWGNRGHGIQEAYVIHIVTGIAEAKLCDDEWTRGPYTMTMCHYNTDGEYVSLADALSVQIKRVGK